MATVRLITTDPGRIEPLLPTTADFEIIKVSTLADANRYRGVKYPPDDWVGFAPHEVRVGEFTKEIAARDAGTSVTFGLTNPDLLAEESMQDALTQASRHVGELNLVIDLGR